MRQTHTEIQTHTVKDTHTDIEREKHTEIHTHRLRDTHCERDSHICTLRERNTHWEIHNDTD